MLRKLMGACVVAGCFVLASIPLPAQEIIHALTGTVGSINNAAKTFTVFQDTGSSDTYRQMSDTKARISFDKHMESTSTAAASFDKPGAYVIVFYIGRDNNRTAVAFKNLGAGPFQSIQGTVTRYDSHSHVISVQDESGVEQSFRIDPETVAETAMGAVPGQKFQAGKGDKVRIVSGKADGMPTVLFVRNL